MKKKFFMIVFLIAINTSSNANESIVSDNENCRDTTNEIVCGMNYNMICNGTQYYKVYLYSGVITITAYKKNKAYIEMDILNKDCNTIDTSNRSIYTKNKGVRTQIYEENILRSDIYYIKLSTDNEMTFDLVIENQSEENFINSIKASIKNSLESEVYFGVRTSRKDFQEKEKNHLISILSDNEPVQYDIRDEGKNYYSWIVQINNNENSDSNIKTDINLNWNISKQYSGLFILKNIRYESEPEIFVNMKTTDQYEVSMDNKTKFFIISYIPITTKDFKYKLDDLYKVDDLYSLNTEETSSNLPTCHLQILNQELADSGTIEVFFNNDINALCSEQSLSYSQEKPLLYHDSEITDRVSDYTFYQYSKEGILDLHLWFNTGFNDARQIIIKHHDNNSNTDKYFCSNNKVFGKPDPVKKPGWYQGIYDDQVVIGIEASPNAEYYEIFINEDNDKSNARWAASTRDLNATISKLDKPAYFWIKSKSKYGDSTFSNPTYAWPRIYDETQEPISPYPVDKSIDISICTELIWLLNKSARKGKTFDVYLSTNNPPELYLSDVDSTDIYPYLLKENATYFWKVLSKDDLGEYFGETWSFTTSSNADIEYYTDTLSQIFKEAYDYYGKANILGCPCSLIESEISNSGNYTLHYQDFCFTENEAQNRIVYNTDNEKYFLLKGDIIYLWEKRKEVIGYPISEQSNALGITEKEKGFDTYQKFKNAKLLWNSIDQIIKIIFNDGTYIYFPEPSEEHNVLIEITKPLENENLIYGTQIAIQWISKYSKSQNLEIKIIKATNNGNAENIIIENTTDDGEFIFNVDYESNAFCQIKITCLDDNKEYFSPLFSIITTPPLVSGSSISNSYTNVWSWEPNELNDGKELFIVDIPGINHFITDQLEFKPSSNQIQQGYYTITVQEKIDESNWSYPGKFSTLIDIESPESKLTCSESDNQYALYYTLDDQCNEYCNKKEHTQTSGIEKVELWAAFYELSSNPDPINYTLKETHYGNDIGKKFIINKKEGYYFFKTIAYDNAENVEIKHKYDIKRTYSSKFAGYSLIIIGKNTGEDLTKFINSGDFVYKTIVNRNFAYGNIEDIDNIILYYLPPDSSSDYSDKYEGDYKEAIKNAIIEKLYEKMKNKPGPIYITMIGHGSDCGFGLGDGNITSDELNEWLTTLENKLDENKIEDNKIVLILGHCNSGCFIEKLGSHRRLVVVASTGKDGVSAQGGRESNDGDYFIYSIYQHLNEGMNLYDAFSNTIIDVELHNNEQKPIFNADNDNIGTDNPTLLTSANGEILRCTDCEIASTITLGYTSIIDDYYVNISDAGFGSSRKNDNYLSLYIEVTDYTRTQSAYVKIENPHKEFIEINGNSKIEMTFNENNKRYEININSKYLEQKGTYNFYFFANYKLNINEDFTLNTLYKKLSFDNNSYESELLEKCVLKLPEKGTNVSPIRLKASGKYSDFILMDWSVENRDEQLNKIYEFSLYISQDESFSLTNTINVPELDKSFYLFEIPKKWTESDNNEKKQLFWKVITVDENSSYTQSETGHFYFQFVNNYSSTLSFIVKNNKLEIIENAQIFVHESDKEVDYNNSNNFILTDFDGSAIKSFDIKDAKKSDNYTIYIKVNGYIPQTKKVLLNAKETKCIEFNLLPIFNKIDDELNFLKILTDIEINISNYDFDINKDQKIGLQEIIYLLLQKIEQKAGQ